MAKSPSAGGRLEYQYDGDRVIGEYGSSGQLVGAYDFGADLVRGTFGGAEGARWYHSDGQGSVTALGSGAGAGAGLTWRREYDAWGGILAATGGSLNAVGYTGQRLDAETGLMALGNGERYYAPRLGRFTQQDSYVGRPMEPASLNRYGYGHGNPLRYTDPSGHAVTPETIWDAASLGVGASSLYVNYTTGEYGEAALDAVGVAVDLVAVAVPILPGGVGMALRASRLARHGIDVLQAADAAVNVYQATKVALEQISEGKALYGTLSAGMALLGARQAAANVAAAGRGVRGMAEEFSGTGGRAAARVVKEARGDASRVLAGLRQDVRAVNAAMERHGLGSFGELANEPRGVTLSGAVFGAGWPRRPKGASALDDALPIGTGQDWPGFKSDLGGAGFDGGGGGLGRSGDRGYVSGFREIRKKYRAAMKGDGAAAAEIRAAKALRAEGTNVHFRTAAGDLGLPGRTSDFLVGGERGTGVGGLRYEVYSPTTNNTGRISGWLGKKLPQADRFILDLTRTELGVGDVANFIHRINKIPNISRPVREILLLDGESIVGRLN